MEEQIKLKGMLNIRTFDELQKDLSKRQQYEDLLKGQCH